MNGMNRMNIAVSWREIIFEYIASSVYTKLSTYGEGERSWKSFFVWAEGDIPVFANSCSESRTNNGGTSYQ
jgi:hypothetical protein